MPFDGKVSDYTKVAPVFDRDNPPTRMSDAIRMAVADVTRAEAVGLEINMAWCFEDTDEETRTLCTVCAAGAVMVCSLGSAGDSAVGTWGSDWSDILISISAIAYHHDLLMAYGSWPEGFSVRPDFSWSGTSYKTNPIAFKRDMLALADRLQGEGS